MKTIAKNIAFAAVAVLAGTSIQAKDLSPKVELGTDKNLASEYKVSNDNEKEAKSKPYFRVDKAVVSVNMLTIDEAPVEIKVYDKYNNLLHRETLKGEKSTGKRFDFSEAAKGTYVIVVKHKGSTFTETLEM